MTPSTGRIRGLPQLVGRPTAQTRHWPDSRLCCRAVRRSQFMFAVVAGVLGVGANTLHAQVYAPPAPLTVTNLTVAPAYTPQIDRPTVAIPETTPIPVPATPEEFAQTNALAASQRPAWRPTPVVPPQPQNLIANQLRRPTPFAPPSPAPFNTSNISTNQPAPAVATPAPASTNMPAPIGPWQQQNPLLRGLRYHW